MTMDEKKDPTDAEIKDGIQKNIKCIAEGIKLSSSLPVKAVRKNFFTCFPHLEEDVEPLSTKLLSMLSGLLQREGFRVDIENCESEDKVDVVVDGVNKILDRVKDNLSELNGTKRNPLLTEPSKSLEKNFSGSWNRDPSKTVRWKANTAPNYSKPALRMQKVFEKPQDKFEVKINNTNLPFEPKLMTKPNAIKPLAIYLEKTPSGQERYCHPYLHELNSFKVPQDQLRKVEPTMPSDFSTSSAVYVDSDEALDDMLCDLRKEKELAVDLEHHSYRSYQGLTCLMQISSRKKDYIIDTLALRDKLWILNDIFTDPTVVKVFHDANGDVIWLQKDLNLYVVNVFDTYLASLSLNFAKLSLSYLLKEFCNVEPDKRYQLFDWRTRPLPETALSYARSDTHYLLYLYDKLRNALLDKNGGSTQLLESVYSRGVAVCKKRHEKLTGENDYLTLYKQSKQTFDNRQMHALKALYEWRDQIARNEDESTGFVLPNHMLLQIAEMLPREMQGILACCNPVPTLVRKNLSHLHQLINVSRNQSVRKTIVHSDVHSASIYKNPILSKLRCPHDFSHHDDFRDNLTTLLDGSDQVAVSSNEISPSVSVFDDLTDSKMSLNSRLSKSNPTVVKFVSPYERYKRTMVFLASMQEKEKENTKKEDARPDIVYSSKSNRTKVEAANQPTLSNTTKKQPQNKEEPSQRLIEKVKSENLDDVPSTNTKKRKLSDAADQSSTKRLSTEGSFKKESADVEIVQIIDADSTLSSSSSASDSLSDDDVIEATMKKEPGEIPKKKRKRRRKGKNDDQRESQSESGKKNFTPFDYSKANFNRFVTSGQKNVKQLLGSKITFGANKRELKKKKFKRGKHT